MIHSYPFEQDSLDTIAANIGSEPFGIRTGLTQLDEMTRGLHPGELTVIAGRSSMGKSSLMTDIILNVDCPVAIFSLEMSYKILCERMIANFTNTNYHYLKLQRIPVPSVGKLNSKSITILDNSYLTPLKFKEQLEQLKEKEGIKCCFVDFLQLMRTDFPAGSRSQEVDNICQDLRAVGKELGIAVVLLAQLNREVEKRDNHQPRLSDLRESGGIEQAADVVLLIHRPSYYNVKEVDLESEDDGEAFIYVSKNRSGPVGKCPVVWISEYMSFRDIKSESF